METRTISKTRRVDSVRNGNSCGGDDYCVCFAFEDLDSERESVNTALIIFKKLFLY